MATIANLDTMIAQAINDPNHDEVAAVSVAGSDMLRWINQICYDASILTDCLQFTGTITADATPTEESFALPAATAASGQYGTVTPSTYWRTLNIIDRTNGRKYLPIPRDQYQDYYVAIISNGASGLYVYNIFGYGSSRKIYILPILTGSVTVEFSETHPDIAYSAGTETPRGILNQYDRLIVEGVKCLYYQSEDDEQQAQIAFTIYMDWIKRLTQEVGTNPSIDPEMSSIYRQFYKAIKAVKES